MTLTFVNTMATLNRSKGIGGSDASRIMRGEWRDLYLRRSGRNSQTIYLACSVCSLAYALRTSMPNGSLVCLASR